MNLCPRLCVILLCAGLGVVVVFLLWAYLMINYQIKCQSGEGYDLKNCTTYYYHTDEPLQAPELFYGGLLLCAGLFGGGAIGACCTAIAARVNGPPTDEERTELIMQS